MKKLWCRVFCCILFFATCHNCIYAFREEGIHLIEVHVSFYCYRLNKNNVAEILLLKRTDDRQIAPGKWECGGGQVRVNESFELAAKRQLWEETGLHATHWRPLGCFEMKIENKIIPGLEFACRVSSDSEVKIDHREHVKYQWATLDGIKDLDFVDQKMKQTITRLLISQSRAW